MNICSRIITHIAIIQPSALSTELRC